MTEAELNYFRPKARHIFTIWRDLIKDDFSALIELVKNSYDADAKKVEVFLNNFEDSIEIIIKDNWHGMAEKDIREKWLVPSTDNKIWEGKSPGKRIFQWHKGIWRYAASVLWDEITIETIKEWIKTIVNINWDLFNEDKFLDEIPINIETEKTKETNWTIIKIIWNKIKLDIWSGKQIERLENELSQLLFPFDMKEKDIFNIFLNWETVSPYSLSSFYDYKISWNFLQKDSKITFTYFNSDKKEEIPNEILINKNDCYFSDDISRELPWDFSFEFLVIDRDPVKEREEVSKIMWNPRELTRSKTKKDFDSHSWIKLYRWWFRIRPYWEKNDDWLWLNSRRVNQPTLRLSTNQVLGYIKIWNEDDSWLKELTSRWWLIENKSFWWLKCIIWKILWNLELKRRSYRKETGLWRTINKKLEYDQLKDKIISTIDNVDIPNKEEVTKELSLNINTVFERIKDREQYLENILFIYERQATLWKIIGELIHEIKQPLSYFKWKSKKLGSIIENLSELMKYNENIEELRNISINYKENSLRILRFLKNIEPLANNRRKEDYISLHEILKSSFSSLNTILNEKNINSELPKEDYKIYCDKTDLIVAFSNFIDNSIYWLWLKESKNKLIQIENNIENENLVILFKDNWSWLIKKEFEKDIFDPGVTLKEKGTGLWLSIAWEVLKRNNIVLSLVDSESWFILKLIVKKWKK